MNNAKFCPACGAKNDRSGRFCGNCGANLEMAMPPSIQKENKPSFIKATLIFLVVLFGFACFAASMKGAKNNDAPKAKSELVFSTVNDEIFVCKDLTTLGKMNNIIKTKDYGYMQKLVDKGDVFIISKGTSIRYDIIDNEKDFVWVIVKSGYHAERTGYIPRYAIQ